MITATTTNTEGEHTVRCAGKRFRVVVYRCFAHDDNRLEPPTAWSGFVESPYELLGFAGEQPDRRRTMIACARLIAQEIR